MINKIDVDVVREQFLSAEPFPHVIIDNFLIAEVFDAISKEMVVYYDENKDKGKRWNSIVEAGKWGSTGLQLPQNISALDNFLKSEAFLSLLQSISGFENLKVTANINGIGFSFFHAMGAGSYLGPHTDHTRDLGSGPYHVLNIIIYMSESWNPNWGGGTTIFDPRVKLKSNVEYKPNRALIFMHSPDSIHGTQKISELAGGMRFSIYYDYYTHDSEPYAHVGRSDFKLIDSPHLFYLPSALSYLQKENRRYLKMHLANIKNRLMHSLFGG